MTVRGCRCSTSAPTRASPHDQLAARRSISRRTSPRSRRRGCWCASTARSTRTPSCTRWCAGSSRAGSREDQRRAFLFTNVVDAAGRRYDMPVAVGALAASPRIYAVGMGRPVEEIEAAWVHAIAHPIPPVAVVVAAVPGGRDHRATSCAGRARDWRAAGAGLDAGLRRRALSHRDALRHARSRHRHPEHGHLSRRARRRPTGSACAWPRASAAPAATCIGRSTSKRGDADAVRDRDRLRAGRDVHRRQKLPIDLDEMAVAGGLAGAPIRIAQGRHRRSQRAGRRRDRDRRADRSRAARARRPVRRKPRPRRARGLQHVDAGDGDHAQAARRCSRRSSAR